MKKKSGQIMFEAFKTMFYKFCLNIVLPVLVKVTNTLSERYLGRTAF